MNAHRNIWLIYHLYGYKLSDNPSTDPYRWSESCLSSDNNALTLLEINLSDYRESDISDIGLSQLNIILEYFSNSEKQIILRFLYDWDGNGADYEPDSVDIIKKHIVQTAEIVNHYSSNVYILQGLFTGSYGEMNGTKYGSAEYMSELTAATSFI